MKTSIQSIITEVLSCSENNRAAVVHYGASGLNSSTTKIWIESDFTSNATTATTFLNRNSSVGSSDYAHEALGLIGNALDNVVNANIVSPQKTLNHDPLKSLVIFLFTDAERSYVDSFLVNHTSSGPGNAAFTNYTNFKNIRDARFVVTIIPPSTAAIQAATAIASGGGAYTGSAEYYSANPDASATGRFLYDATSTGFDLDISGIEIISDYICSVAVPDCVDTLILTSSIDDVTTTDNRQTKILISASNKINSGGVGIYHSEDTVLLTSGFHSANGSRFRGYIRGCNSGYEGRPGLEDKESSMLSNEEIKLFTLSPNPTSDMVAINSTDSIQNIIVTSYEGKVIFNKDFNGKDNSFELNVRDYIDGFYTVTVITADGKTETQKLIKN